MAVFPTFSSEVSIKLIIYLNGKYKTINKLVYLGLKFYDQFNLVFSSLFSIL